MKKRLSFSILISLLSFFGVPASAQQPAATPPPAPEVELDGAGDPNEPRAAASIIEYEPDGRYVAYTNFLKILRSIDPGSGSEWDSLQGMLTVKADGHTLKAFSNRVFVIIDQTSQSSDKPIRVKNGVVFLPVRTVRMMLKAIDPDYESTLPFDLPEPSPTEAPPATPAPTAEPGAPPMTATPAPAGAAPRAGTESLLAPAGSLLGGETARPPLEAPPGLGDAKGLNWAALADRAHSMPPVRGAIICDNELRPLADRLEQLLTDSLGVYVSVLGVGGRRAGSVAAAQVSVDRPGFVIDLISAPRMSDDPIEAAFDRTVEIWAAHEALWPGDATMPEPPPYRRHQFQNVAMGSLVRGELSKSLPQGTVRFSLSPSWLLRRADCPSIGALIPPKMAADGSEDLTPLSRGIAAGVAGYFRAVQSAGGR